MRPLSRGIRVGAVAASLTLTVPLGAAGAETPPRPSQPAQARPAPVEPAGQPAPVGAMRAGRLNCGDRITKSTTLTADVGPCPGNGIIIGADNIIFNLNGHTISGTPGPGSGNDGGIRLPNRKGVTVTGLPGTSGIKGTVTGFDAGVVVNGGSNNTIENLVVRDNVGPDELSGTGEWWEPPAAELGDGIVIFKSPSNRITNNVVIHNGVYDGIGVFGLGSNSNTVRGNTVENTVGIFGNRSGSGTGIIINHFLDQAPGTLQTIEGNRAIGNRVRRNLGSGISSVGNRHGEIVGNEVVENGLEYAAYAEVDWDLAAHGIGVRAGGGLGHPDFDPNLGVLVKDNEANHNGLHGIYIDGSGISVERNQVFNNGAVGLVVGAASTTFMPANSITYNSTGYNFILDLFDMSGPGWVPEDQYCADNVWWGNTWGPLQPKAEEWGFTAAYYPECAAAGGSGPNPPVNS